MSEQLLTHPLLPIWNERSRVLVLGTFPSPASRAATFFYGHPRNRFWSVICAVLDERLPETNEGKRALCLRRGLALWDVIARCRLQGAADDTIRDVQSNDLTPLLQSAPIDTIFTTGATAWRLYERLLAPVTGIPAVRLPSPSPANASWSFDRLVEAYRPLARALNGSISPGKNEVLLP